MHLNIEHRTYYAYKDPVNYTIQNLRLTPQDGFGQRVRHWLVRVNGSAQSYADAYGNLSHTLVLDTPHSEVSITACGEIETGLDIPPPPDSLPLLVYSRTTPLTAADGRLAGFAHGFATSASVSEVDVHALMAAMSDRVLFQKDDPGQPVGAAQAFADGACGCQDYVHIFIACCRYLGIPARYVSGYRYLPDGACMQSHAWADVWLQDSGWLSFDPVSGGRANGMHVRLATGLDERDARPISSAYGRRDNMVLTCSLQAHCLEKCEQERLVGLGVPQ